MDYKHLTVQEAVYHLPKNIAREYIDRQLSGDLDDNFLNMVKAWMDRPKPIAEQDFLDLASESVTLWYKPEVKNRYAYVPGHGYKARRKKSKDASFDDVILTEWTISSVSGGNCWESDADYHTSAGDNEPGFDCLDTILDKVCPKITYKQYRDLISGQPKLIEYGDYTRNEYYGNSTTYGYKKIVLRILWNKLNEMGLL